MASQLFVEIGAEEIPAGFIGPALEHMAQSLSDHLTAARITYGAVNTGGTPRRLTVWIEDVAERQDDVEEVKTGPPARIAFDADGKPTRAALGFARGAGVSADALFTTTTPKGEYLAARVHHKGQDTSALLESYLPDWLRTIPFRKSMRWGSNAVTFARPVRWICALFGGAVIPCAYGPVESGAVTYGHRFMSPDPIEVTDAAQYLDAMAKANVVVDIEARRATIRAQLAKMADDIGGRVVEDEELVEEVANLCEDPWGGVGQFDPARLELPREVLISSMREHQRYFAFEDADGGLMPHFGVFNNTRVRDPKLALYGNARVLKARLHDATFFHAEDRKRTLESRIGSLERVTFLGELSRIGQGSDLLSRAKRIEALTGAVAALAWPDAPEVATHAQRAAALCKADLTTLMVGEFPDLQGTIGMYYARADGEPDAVADAIGEHYQPRGAADAPPASAAGACLALADKLELIAACFAVGATPSSNKDPYGLRRATLGALRILDHHGLDVDLSALIGAACAQFGAGEDVAAQMLEFFGGRLRAELTRAARTDIVDAVLAAGFTHTVQARARVAALSEVAREADLSPIGEAFKRIHNILQRNAEAIDASRAFDLEATAEDAERALGELAVDIKRDMADHLAQGQWREALNNLTRLRQPLDAFFTHVMVMHEDADLRANRLALLLQLRQTFETVADVSRIHVAS